jgi:type VI secretion system protein VasG
VDNLTERCTHNDSGARLIDHLIDLHLQPLVVDRLLDAMAQGETLQRIHATCDEEGALTCEFV